MMETLFTTTPFTTTPLSTLPFQTPLAVGHRPIAPQVFGSPANGIYPTSFLPQPSPVIVGDTTGIPAPSLLAAVAIRRGQPQGPTNDHEVEEFIYDALELLPGAADVEVRCEGGRATLTGSVQHKRTKRDIGEVAWAIPALNDVQNNVTITSRRRGRTAGRDTEPAAAAASRK